jgi:hypothetical protein
MSLWRFALEVVGQFLVRRIPAMAFFFAALVSFVVARVGSFSDTVSSVAMMFIGLAMLIVFAVVGVWFMVKAPENVREFFKDRLYGTLMLILPILLGVITVGFDSDFPVTDAGMLARYYACVLLAIASGISAFFLIKGERL